MGGVDFPVWNKLKSKLDDGRLPDCLEINQSYDTFMDIQKLIKKFSN